MSDGTEARALARIGLVLRRKYRIEGLLGVGGMAAVYSASHRNGRQVAVKLLHPELSLRSDIRKRFLREAQAANAINHDGVVNVIDDDVADDGAAFLVMELLHGRSVEELWTQCGGRLSAATVLAIARELADVLVVAHRAGIVHRDIKPANLFVTSDNRLKVLDFGIARVRDFATTNLTDTGMLLGTPAFMAPEQAQGRVSEIDETTDVWAVGAMMFTLLSGRVVHEGETAQHMTILAATQPARSLAAVAPDAPPALVELVDRALAFSKSDRWASANALRCAVVEASVRLYGEADLPLDYDALSTTRAGASELPPTTDLDPVPYYRIRIGKTTSSPVSSSAPTEPRHKSGAWSKTLRMAPFARTLVSAFQSVRSAIRRGSRSVPIVNAAGDAQRGHVAVSHEGPAVAPRRSRPPLPSRVPLAVMLVGGASLAVGVAAVVGSSDLFAARNNSGAMTVESRPAPPSAVTSAAPPTPTTPAPTSTASGNPAQTLQVISLDDDTSPRAAAPPSSARPKTSPRSTPRSTLPPPQKASPSPPSSPRPDCNPPYTFDEYGEKHFKKECPLQ